MSEENAEGIALLQLMESVGLEPTDVELSVIGRQHGPRWDALLQEANEILGTKDASDFDDALCDSIMRVNDWAPVATRAGDLPPLGKESISRVLGEEDSERVWGAISSRSLGSELPSQSDYLSPLYSTQISPERRMNLFDYLCGQMAHTDTHSGSVEGFSATLSCRSRSDRGHRKGLCPKPLIQSTHKAHSVHLAPCTELQGALRSDNVRRN